MHSWKYKKCCTCKKLKNINEFNKNKSRKEGLRHCCRECDLKYRLKNRNKILNLQRKWLKNNPEYNKKYYKNNIEKSKEYRKDNAEKIRDYFKNYYKNNAEYFKAHRSEWNKNNLDKFRNYASKRRENPKTKLSSRISIAIYKSLKANKNGKHWETLLNFTLQELIKHLEKQFKPGMTWQNIGKWHIDHIKPVSSFKFESPEDPGLKECWALDNLQPLWAEENRRKSNRVFNLREAINA